MHRLDIKKYGFGFEGSGPDPPPPSLVKNKSSNWGQVKGVRPGISLHPGHLSIGQLTQIKCLTFSSPNSAVKGIKN